MSSKAQVLTYDFFIAVSIFLFILSVIGTYWVYWMNEILGRRKSNEMINTLLAASEIWFKEGYPRYWTPDNVLEVGMSNGNVINSTKMRYLEKMGYQKFLSLTNLNFDVFYRVLNESDGIIFEFPEDGIPPNYKNLLKIERLGVLNSSIVKVQTIVWE